MRPSHRAEGQNRVGAIEDRRADPLRAADRKGNGASAAVAPRAKPLGQFAARPGDAGAIQSDEQRAGRQRGEDQLGLTRLQKRRRQAPLFFQLEDRRRRDKPFGIVGLEVV